MKASFDTANKLFERVVKPVELATDALRVKVPSSTRDKHHYLTITVNCTCEQAVMRGVTCKHAKELLSTIQNNI